MSVVDGWLDWTKHVPGVADKVYSQANAGLGLALHSIEGIDRTDHIPDRFLSTERWTNPTTGKVEYTPNATASVMFVNPVEGPLIQMYPVTASTWTSGCRAANTSLWAVESEGFAGTPLNDGQVENMRRLAEEFTSRQGTRATRDPAARTVWEHNEVWNWSSPNAGPTACPSGRYAPFYTSLEVDMSVLDDVAAVLVGNYYLAIPWEDAAGEPSVLDLFPPGTVPVPRNDPNPGARKVPLTGAKALAYAVRRGFSFAYALQLAQDDIAALRAAK